jgi:threonine/homoserine/homoserine lactone efflux protein
MELTIVMKYIVLIGFGIFLGFLSAIPVGAVQMEVAKKALKGHLWHAIAIAFGSASSDFIYGVLTLFSIGHFLHNKKVQFFTYALGIVVLGYVFIRSYQEYRDRFHPDENPLIYKKHYSFLTGFSIAITNPGMIIWWIVGFQIFLDLQLFTKITPVIRLIFILSGCSGLFGYLLFIAHLLHRMQKTISDTYIHRMLLVLMVLLAILIAYFSYRLFCFSTGVEPVFGNVL